MSKESIQGPLSALRNAGTVCGVCLARETEVLVNLFPYSEDRINDMVAAVEEVRDFFSEKGRSVDQMSLGFDGGCLCVIEDGEFRLIVMHLSPEEVDFIAKAARAFLADFQLGFFTEQFSSLGPRLDASPDESEEPEWQRKPEAPAASEEFDVSAIYTARSATVEEVEAPSVDPEPDQEEEGDSDEPGESEKEEALPDSDEDPSEEDREEPDLKS